jgi:hypothetical protein
MAATKRQFNWRGVSFTPTSTTLVPITGVTSVEVDENGTAAKFSGDGDQGPTTVIKEFLDQMITITAADLIAIRSLPAGTRGAFAAIHKDAKQVGATAQTGDISYAVGDPKAYIVNNPVGGGHRKFGEGRIIICTEWADGATNPLASSVTA